MLVGTGVFVSCGTLVGGGVSDGTEVFVGAGGVSGVVVSQIPEVEVGAVVDVEDS